jgi:transcription elongation factor GreA
LTEKPTYLTAEGKHKLEEELSHLRLVRRPEVAKRIHDAKDDGDISENAGYDEAKNEQAFVEGRIMTLEALLSRVEIINDGGNSEHVSIGSRVTVIEEGASPETFLIVGAAESDPANGRISNESPLGHSLIGRKAGEQLRVDTPDGPVRYELLDIS